MKNIKLIIWDLDETFWKGTLSEEGIKPIKRNIELIKQLTDRGIINSIVSKNNFNDAKKKLIELGVWKYFIFPQIAWKPKGQLVKQLLEKIYLRPNNVLFIDDNHLNLKEVNYYNHGINVKLPDFIPELLNNTAFKGKDDSNHSRLKQYKILEQKDNDKQKATTNNDFLFKSNIQVSISKPDINFANRIHELIERTNQLNYTKKRISLLEVQKLIKNEQYDVGSVSVKDNYGDYGIVGFYALNKITLELEHFLFSCRTINLGIEQFIYGKLEFPKLRVEGDVVTKLEKESIPKWISLIDETQIQHFQSKKNVIVLLRGGCDLSQMVHYLSYTGLHVTEEFNYVLSNNIPIHREHTIFLNHIDNLTSKEKQDLVNELPFIDKGAFITDFFNEKYDVLIYSLLMDYTQGIYLKKINNIEIPFGGYIDVTALSFSQFFNIYSRYKSKLLDYSFYSFFKKNYTYNGGISPQSFIANLRNIRKKTNKPIIFINGSEIKNPAENTTEKGSLERHKVMNKALDDFLLEDKNSYLLDMRKLVFLEDITNNLRHYSRDVYKRMAVELSLLIQEISHKKLKKRLGSIFIRDVKFRILELISTIRKKLF